MLGGDRAAGGGDEVVDHPRDGGTLAIVPVGRGVAGGADVEVDIAVAEMAEAAGDHPGESAFDLGRRLDEEARHVGDRDRNVVRQRLALSALGLRDGVADAPEGVGLGLA